MSHFPITYCVFIHILASKGIAGRADEAFATPGIGISRLPPSPCRES